LSSTLLVWWDTKQDSGTGDQERKKHQASQNVADGPRLGGAHRE